MKIHQITDLHIPNENAGSQFAHIKRNIQRQLEFIEASSPDLLVISGDLTMTDHSEEACRWLKSELPQNLDVIIMSGNHDDPQILWEVFGARYCRDRSFFYEYQLGTHKLVFLNTTSNTVPAEQLSFVESLDDSKQRLLFMHHPPDLVSPGGFMAENQPLLNHREAAASISASPVGHVFSGHYHNSVDMLCDGFELHVTSSPAFQIDLKEPSFTPEPFEPLVREILIGPEEFQTSLVTVQ